MNGERRRYRGTLSYDGTAYNGFQRQRKGVPTVQAVVEAAIERVTGQGVTVSGAGRTDTGVHATGQVIAFDVEWRHEADALLRALNANLPPDIALFDLVMLPEGTTFHPRFSAESRVYRYEVFCGAIRQPLYRNRVWQIRDRLDGDALERAAACLIGEYDFGAFGLPPQGESTVRRVMFSRWSYEPELRGEWWRYTVEANAFLQHMVRRIVGHLVDVGRGWRTVAEFQDVFDSAQLAPRWTVAPPQGLTLVDVKYSNEGIGDR